MGHFLKQGELVFVPFKRIPPISYKAVPVTLNSVFY